MPIIWVYGNHCDIVWDHSGIRIIGTMGVSVCLGAIREIKFDVYGKRQTAKMKLLPSVFSSLYSRIKIFVFAVNSKRHFSIFVSLN